MLKDEKLAGDEVDQHGCNGHAELSQNGVYSKHLDQPWPCQQTTRKAENTNAEEGSDFYQTAVTACFEDPENIGDVSDCGAENDSNGVADGTIQRAHFIRDTGVNGGVKGIGQA